MLPQLEALASEGSPARRRECAMCVEGLGVQGLGFRGLGFREGTYNSTYNLLTKSPAPSSRPETLNPIDPFKEPHRSL